MVIRWLRSLFAFWSAQKPYRRRTSTPRCCPPYLEVLEARLAPTVYTWVPTAASTYAWNIAANWSPNTGFPNSSSDTANLTSALAGNETINLTQAITVGFLNIGSSSGTNTFTLAAGGGSLSLGGSATIAKTGGGADVLSAPITLSAATTVNDSSTNGLTLSGGVSGSFGLTKQGSGPDILSGASTYSGGTTVSGGNLTFSNQAIPAGSVSLSSGATLQCADSSNIIQPGGITLTGTGRLLKTGAGTLTFGGGSGGTINWLLGAGALIDVQGGTLVGGDSIQDVWSNNQSSNLSSLNIAAGATFAGVEANVRVDALTGSGTLQSGYNGAGYSTFTVGVNNDGAGIYNTAGTATFNGTIANTNSANPGNLTKTGTGTQILGGANSYSGGTTVSGGNLTFSNQAIPAGSVSLSIGATLQYADSSNIIQPGGITLTGTGTLLKTGAGTLTFGGGSGTINWQLGAGALIDVQGGTLVGGNSIQDVWSSNLSSLNIAAGATFAGVEANVRVDALTGSGTLQSGNNGAGYSTFTVGVNNDGAGAYNAAGTATFNGTIANTNSATPGNLTKIGTGTQILGGASTYSGGTTVSQGTLVAAAPAGTALGSGTVTEAGGTLSINPPTGPSPLASPLALTGFNQDAVWAIADSSASAGTTTTLDGNTVFYEAGLSGAPAGTGLPNSRVFTSAANSAVTFALQPYTQNNVLLTQTTTGQTLTLSTSGKFQSLNFLDAAANGAAAFTFTLNFADGTTTTSSTQTAPDWFNGSPYALAGINRAVRSSGGFDGSGTYGANNPRLYEQDYTLAAGDQAKTLSSITFNWASGGTLGIFAVSGSWLASSGPSYSNSVVLSASSTLDVPSGDSATLTGVVSGSGGLTKTSGGTLILSGANTYTGATAISGGTLTVSSLANGGTASGIGASSNAATNLVLNGGTLQYTGAAVSTDRLFSVGTSGGTLDASGSDTLTFTNTGSIGFNSQTGARTLTLTGSGSASLAAVLGDNSGPTALTKTGSSGTWTVTAMNTYTGATTISAGTLRVADDLALGNNSAVTIADGAALSAAATGLSGQYYNLTPVSSGSDPSFTSLSALEAHFQGQPLALQALSSANGINFDFGTNGVGFPAPYNSGSAANFEALYTGQFNAQTAGTNSYTFSTSSDDGSVLFIDGQMVVNNNFVQAFTQRSGSIDLAQGMHDIVIGYYQSGGGHGLQAFLNDTPLANALLTPYLDLSIGSLAGAGSVALGGSQLTVGGNNSSTVFSGSLSGSNAGTSLFKIGSGTLTLGGANTYSGATTISGGTLQDGVANALPTTTALAISGTGTFDLNGSAQQVASLADGGVSSGTLTDSAGSATFTDHTSGADSFSGLVSGALSLAMTGSGTLILSGANTYSGGTTISGGTLQDGAANALPITTALAISGTGTFDLNGSAQQVASLADGGVSSGTLTDSAGSATFTDHTSGADSFSGLVSGALSLAMTGSGTLILSGANTYSGGTTISGGTLQDGAANALPITTALAITGTGTFDLNGFAQQVASLADGGVSSGTLTDSAGSATFTDYTSGADSFSGLVSGALSLSKSGSGSLTLNHANTYTGSTILSGGVLIVSLLANGGTASNIGQSSNAATNLVLNGGTLQYTGAAVSSDRLFSVGSSGGTLDASGSGTLSWTNTGSVGFNSQTGARTLTLTGSGSASLAAVLGDNSGPTALTKTGSSGTWTVTAMNTYTGATTISAGTLRVANDLALGNNSAVTVAGGATLSVAAGTAGTGLRGQYYNLTPVNSGSDPSFTSLTALETHLQGQPLALQALSSAAGSSFDFGTSGVGFPSPYNSGSATNFEALYIGQFNAQTAGTNPYTFSTSSDDGSVLFIDGTLVVNNNFFQGFKQRSGSINLAQGMHDIVIGYYQGSGGYGLQAFLNGSSTPLANALLTPYYNLSIGSLAGAGSVALSGSQLTVGGNNSSTVFTGSLSGSNAVTSLFKIGSGTLTLGGANTYGGGTLISGGTLQAGAANALPTTTALAISGTGTFDLNGFAQQVASLADGGVSSGTLTDSAGSATFTDHISGSDTFRGLMSGAVNLSMTGSGSLTLAGANTYSGSTTISGGTLQVGNGGTTGSLGSGAVLDNASLVFNFSSSINLASAISGTGALTLTSTAGAVSQSVPITMPTLAANASTGIALTNAGNSLTSFSASNHTSGDISLTTAAVLSITGITQLGGGAVSVLSTGSNTALTVNGTVSGIGGSITLQATGNLIVAANQTISGTGGALTLGADLTAGGSGDDGVGTLTINAGASVLGTAITMRGADEDIASTASVTAAAIQVATLAGSARQTGSSDGTGSATRFDFPFGVAVDSAGNVYVADTGNDTIRKITPAGVVATLAGSAGQTGSSDGTGSAALFNDPFGVAVDSAGNVYVADTGNDTIRKITPVGVGGYVVTTLAGAAGQIGSSDGTGSAALFNSPRGVAVDSAGNVYVADTGNDTIRKITPVGVGGYVVTTLAGSAGQIGSSDGTGSAALFNSPRGVAVDSAGNVYVADTGNDTIRKITPAIVGGYVVTTLAGAAGQSGSSDGTGTAARFDFPNGVAVDSAGNVYAADQSNDTIRKITSAGVVTTLAGAAGQIGSSDGTGSAAHFAFPDGVAVDSAGIVYVADTSNDTIRKGIPAGAITIGSSVESRPMSIGGSNNAAVPGINLTGTELARLTTGPDGTLTIGDSSQTGTITFSSATPATSAGAALVVVQLTTGAGQIILDNGGGAGTALNGNGGSISLTAGTGGIVEAASNAAGTADIDNASAVTLTSAGALGTLSQPLQLPALPSLATSTASNNSNQYLAALTTLTPASLNAGSGTVNLQGGTVVLPAVGTIAASSLVNVKGSTLSLGTVNQTVAGLTLTSGSITGTTGVLTSTATIQVQSGSVSAILAGGNGLTKTTGGTVILRGANTYSGNTTLSAGTLQMGAANVIPSGPGMGNVVFNPASGTASLDLNGFSPTFNALSSSGVGTGVIDNTAAGAVTLTVGNANASGSFAGVIQNSGGMLSLTKIGTGSQTLAGNNTCDGATLISAGTLIAAAANALGTASGDTSVSSGATLDVQAAIANENIHLAGTGVGGNGALITSTGSGSLNSVVILEASSAIGGAGSLTINGPISGSYALTKVGNGLLALNGTNTFSGGLTVQAGTLGGTGTVGNVTDNATLNPGAGTGATGIFHTANLAFGSGGLFAVDLNGTAAGAITGGYDQVSATGSIDLTSAALQVNLGYLTTKGDSYTLIDNAGGSAITGAFTDLPEGATLTAGSQQFRISYLGGSSGHDVVLTVVTVSTTTSVSTSQPSVTYGTPVTFTATVSAGSGTLAPAQGSVEFYNGSTDLGPGVFQSSGGISSIWTFPTGIKQLHAGTAQDLHAIYTAGPGFGGSTGALSGGETVMPLALTITAHTNTKTYDGTVSAMAAPTITSGSLVTGDTPSFSEAYPSKNAGTGLTLTPSGSVNDGNGGANYTYTFVPDTTGVINQVALTITAVANTKPYDGTPSAAAIPTIGGGSVVAGDTASFSEAYAGKNAGTGLTLTPSGIVNDGNGGLNYAYTVVPVSTGVINTTALTITAAANTKPYDGATSAAATPTVAGLQGSDTVTGLAETYDNRNAGTGKTLTVTAGFTINDGNGGHNYTYTFVPVNSGVINPAPLTITATANTRTYDGTTSASATPTVTGLATGDTVTGLGETYDNRNAGMNKTLRVTAGFTINDGNGGNNYTVATNTSTSGAIQQATLILTATANNKPYDGSTSAAATPTVSGLQSSDTVTGLAETYDNRNAGTTKALSVAGYTINDGNGGNNYTVATVTSPSGVIDPVALTVTAATNTKPYDGTTSAAATPMITAGSLIAGDVPSFLELYADKNAGTGLTLTPSGSASDGNSGNNYTYTFIPDGTGVINPLALTITATANDKPYDGTLSATAIPTITAGTLATGDTADFTESYSEKNVGTGLTLTPSVSVSDGNDGGNYTYTYIPVATGVINPAALTITAAADTKPYDGTVDSAATPTVDGLAAGDTVTGLGEIYDNRNAGSGKTLSVTAGFTVNDGNGGHNYTVSTVPTSSGVINPVALTVTAVTNTKTYDGSASPATIPTVSSGSLAAGDTPDFLETYDTPNAGTNKTLTPSGTVNDGNGGHNYTYTFVPVATGVINPSDTTVTLQRSPNPGSLGQPVTLSATVTPVSPGAGVPTGKVVFTDGSTPLGTVTLSNGVATLPATFTSLGTHTITAAYVGDPNFTGNTSAPAPESILPASKVILTASSKVSVFGQKFTLTAAVTPAVKAKGVTLTGTVTFLDGAATVGSATLSKGKATLTLATLSAGSHTITMSYGGSSAYGSSTSAALSHTVNRASTSVALTSSATKAAFGQTVTFTAKVKVVAPGVATPSGLVYFLDGTATIGSGTLTGGQASFQIASLIKGKHKISAKYAGDGSCAGKTSVVVVQTIV